MAGGLAGGPIRIVKAITVDLYVPADAEIVIEGLIDSEWLEPEGHTGPASIAHIAGELLKRDAKVFLELARVMTLHHLRFLQHNSVS